MKDKIILDTNFLVAPFQLSIDLFEEIDRLYPAGEVFTVEDAVQEAKSIEEGDYGDLVDKLIDVEGIKVLKTEGRGFVDDLLVQLSDKYVIGTNDKELRERIVERGNPVIIIRQQNYLEILNGRETEL